MTFVLLVDVKNTLFMMKIYVKLVPCHPYRIKLFPIFCGNKIVWKDYQTFLFLWLKRICFFPHQVVNSMRLKILSTWELCISIQNGNIWQYISSLLLIISIKIKNVYTCTEAKCVLAKYKKENILLLPFILDRLPCKLISQKTKYDIL